MDLPSESILSLSSVVSLGSSSGATSSGVTSSGSGVTAAGVTAAGVTAVGCSTTQPASPLVELLLHSAAPTCIQHYHLFSYIYAKYFCNIF